MTRYTQTALTDLGEPLSDVTFVVVDLETTGGPPDGNGVTEIGAVKVRGGEWLGEFATLVDPGSPIPPFIAVLTGITNVMVARAPKIDAVLPGFLEFAQGAVLVAHNAPFDISHLKAACRVHDTLWPRFQVLDTAQIARRVLRDHEVRNRKLATLAAYFQAGHEPCHRALADARATVDVLHGLFERLGSHGVNTLPDLREFVAATDPSRRRKRHLADGLPRAPGVYIFRGHDDRPLYVGTSVDVGARVRSYFTAAESRSRMANMIKAAQRVEAITCAHSLEAQVRELRLIAAHKPPYNRKSRNPERVHWLKLTREPYPRLSIARTGPDVDDVALGPFTSRRNAEDAAAAVHEAMQLRPCTTRLSARKVSAVCALAELRRCPAPCQHLISIERYEVDHVHAFRQAVDGDPAIIMDRLLARIGDLAAVQRYEDAAAVRTRLIAFGKAAVRMQRLRSLTTIAELAAARRDSYGGWELAVVRRGRLVAAGTSPPGAHPRLTLDALLLAAESVQPGPGPIPCATVEETERILDWLQAPQTRVVQTTDGWASPINGAGRWRGLVNSAEETYHRPIRVTA